MRSREEILSGASLSDLGENSYVLYEKIKNIKDGKLVDLGVRGGVSSDIMLIESEERNNKVFGVDVNINGIAEPVLKNSNYKTLLGDSVTIGKRWKEEIDFLFVDTFHIKDQVMCELYYWYPHVKVGSMIAFHDSNWPEGMRDTYGEIQWGRVEEGIMEFFGIDSLTYEDEFVKVENYPESYGMTFVTIKKRKDHTKSENWEEVFQNRNNLISMFWNENNIGEIEIELTI
jgi:predicted O-methyltransferase YrrM